MEKRLLSLLLAFAVVLGMLCVPAFAADTESAEITMKVDKAAARVGDTVAVTVESDTALTGMFGIGFKVRMDHTVFKLDSFETRVYPFDVTDNGSSVKVSFANLTGTGVDVPAGSYVTLIFKAIAPVESTQIKLENLELLAMDMANDPAVKLVGGTQSVSVKADEAHTHKFDQKNTDVKYLISAADCKNAAVYSLSCACGEKGTDTFQHGEPKGHTPADAVRENEKEPGCTTEGSCETVIRCTVCKQEINRETITVPASGHADKDKDYRCDTCGAQLCTKHNEVTVPGYAAACTKEGLTDGVRCSICGLTIKAQETIPTKGHSFKDGKCSLCGTADPNAKPAEPTAPTVNGVYRIYGDNRYETALKVADALKETLKVEKFDTVIVASGSSFADALAGSYLAAVKNAPILITNTHNEAKVQAYIAQNLTANGTVYILGGEAAVANTFEKGLAGTYTVKRLQGANRYDTNLAILAEAGVPKGGEILICTGTGFADSLSASAAGKPILLVRSKLFDNQKNFLKELGGGSKLVIIGGESAVSAELDAELKAYGTTERVGGANRYETSTLLAERFFENPAYAVLAYAKKFPDGLCGGPLANALNAPLILTQTGREDAAVMYTTAGKISSGYVLGGTGLIDDAAARKIFGAEAIYVK